MPLSGGLQYITEARRALPSLQIMSSPLAAQPLKVASVNGSSKGDGSRTPVPVPSRGASPGPSKPLANPADISSPHELTAFVRFHYRAPSHYFSPLLQVETLLEQLDTKFDDMSSQIVERSAFAYNIAHSTVFHH